VSSMDDILRALAEPTRRRIVEQLASGPQPVSELAGRLDASLSTTVQHLSVLQRSGLVRTVKTGRVRLCHLRPSGLKQAEDWFAQRRLRLQRSFDRLERYLDDNSDLDS
jgi:DNA-binding transcriptional ArsR family regulator